MEDQTAPPQETVAQEGGSLLTPSAGSLSRKRPTYKRMIQAAITNLQDDGKPNSESIVSNISETYALGRGSSTRINNILTKMVEDKALIARGKNDTVYRIPKRLLTPSAGKRSKKSASKKRGRPKKSAKKRSKKAFKKKAAKKSAKKTKRKSKK